MNDFVEQCRLEWKRLGVSDPLADEMAADLTSDLSEAEADGISVQELLGSSAFDPPAFAAKWATERGLIPRPPGQSAAHGTPSHFWRSRRLQRSHSSWQRHCS
jgi:hypothetical protein